jgi:hypothetical protein
VDLSKEDFIQGGFEINNPNPKGWKDKAQLSKLRKQTNKSLLKHRENPLRSEIIPYRPFPFNCCG